MSADNVRAEVARSRMSARTAAAVLRVLAEGVSESQAAREAGFSRQHVHAAVATIRARLERPRCPTCGAPTTA